MYNKYIITINLLSIKPYIDVIRLKYHILDLIHNTIKMRNYKTIILSITHNTNTIMYIETPCFFDVSCTAISFVPHIE